MMPSLPLGTIAVDTCSARRMRLCGLAVMLSLLGLAATGCNSAPQTNSNPSSQETVVRAQEAVVVNGGFETGALTPWAVTTNTNPTIPTFPPTKITDLGLTNGGTNRSSSVGSATAGYPVPAGLTASDTLVYPFSGSYAAIVNRQGNGANVNTIEQSATMSASDVDISDGRIHLRFAAAPVLQNPGHPNSEQPYFFLDITNVSTGAQLFSTFNFSNQPGVSWRTAAGAATVLYTNWQAFDISSSGGALNIGDQVKITAIAAGCSPGGHWGELYIDEFGTSFARPNVNVTAPAYTQANADLTYTIMAKNGGGFAATNTVVTFATPKMTDSSSTATTPVSTNTTFVALSAAGASCTSPTVGAAGTVTCNLGTLAAGGSYTFSITVRVPAVPGTYVLPAWVNAGTYNITSTETPTPLTGNLVQTRVTTSTPVDLQTTLTDGVVSLAWGQSDTYTLTVRNNGPVAVTGATIVDTQPSAFSGTTWTCAAAGSAACGAASGSGAINTTANLPVGGSVTYTVRTTVNGSGPGKVVYSAVANPPAGYVQSVAFNNMATDVNNNDNATFTLTASKDPTGTGQGTVVLYPGGFTCASGCTSITPKLSNGTSIALTAAPAAGSAFMGWSGGGCTGLTNPCITSVTADTTITAKFNQLAVTPTIAATSNGNSTNVRPGDTVDYSLTLTLPAGFNWPLNTTNVLPAGLDFVSLSTPVVTGTLTCSAGACTAPTVVTGTTSTLDFGTVACSTAADCTIKYTLRGQVAATATRGTLSPGSVTATNVSARDLPTLAVIEPEVAISRSPSTTTGLLPANMSTVTVTLSNTGSSNAAVVGAVVTAPTPANLTASNYQAGTCPTATPAFGASSATFTFANTSTTLAIGASCYFTYDLTVGSGAPGNSALNVGSASVTTQSIAGAAPPAKVYSASDTGFTLSTAPYANGEPCTTGGNCVSAVCDTDGKCGYAEGDGPCSTSNAATVCRSGYCSTLLVCGPLGGCLADGDCTSSQFCNTQTKTCVAKLVNSTAIPTITGHDPALNGTCSSAVGSAVCVSGVCDTADNLCGFADGDGTCTSATRDTVCRSGACLNSGACGSTGVCLLDTDCNANQYCNTPTKTCVAKLDNGTAIPTVIGHVPTLDATCTASAAAAVCVTGVCDLADNKCGYADGDGPCTGATVNVCRSGTCATSGVCGGCGIDSDCTSAQYCNTPTHQCATKVPNGDAVPTAAGHVPTLDGMCTTDAAQVACQSGVCDTDNKCGLANGDGPCKISGGTVCRSGTCWAASDVCGDANGCAVDADCTALQYCNTATKICTSKLPNGTAIPTVTGHVPALEGTCTPSVGTAVCSSGVCDTADNRCGYADGAGTCKSGDAALDPTIVCRSSVCSVSGVCGVANGGCIVDGDCSSTQYCNTPAKTCVPKLPNGTVVPTVAGHTPTLDGHCNTTVQGIVCESLACDVADNRCGYADGDGTCTATTALVVCRSGVCSKAGVCGVASGCLVDGDCFPTEYCNTPLRTCAPKVINGGPIPTVTGHVPQLDGSCSTTSGVVACLSETCDVKDNLCGLDNGDGPCTLGNGSTICRSSVCDQKDGACGYANGDGPCTSGNAAVVCRSKNCSLAGVCSNAGACYVDADCSSAQFCDTERNACTAKLPNGTNVPTILLHDPVLDGTCNANAGRVVCQSGVCDSDNKCGLVDGDGPCTSTNATTVCRSGKCTNTGVCGENVTNNNAGGASSTGAGGVTSTVAGGGATSVTSGGTANSAGGTTSTAEAGSTSIATGGTTSTAEAGSTSVATGGSTEIAAAGSTAVATGGSTAAATGGNNSTATGGDAAIATGGNNPATTGSSAPNGLDAITGTSLEGGGCSCHVAQTQNSAGGMLAACAVLGLLKVRRRRNRR